MLLNKLDKWYAYFTCVNAYRGLSQRFFLLTYKVKCSHTRGFIFANILSRVTVTWDGVPVRNWVYLQPTGHNHK
jgi:hypothetical protein